jgi:hypothetical protein
MSDSETFTAAAIPEEALDPVSVPVGIFEYSEGSVAAPYVQVKTGRDFVVVDDLYVGGDSEFSGDLTVEGDCIYSGSVGIGTASPSAKLDIAALGDGTELLRFSTERPWVFRQLQTGPSSELDLHSTVDAKTFRITSLDNTTTASFTTSNTPTNNKVILVPVGGKVGIGTETPTSSLHVVGLPAYANNAAAIAGGLTVGAFYRTGGNPDSVCVVH